jgi:TM2 domain-containing membrane protein YozV
MDAQKVDLFMMMNSKFFESYQLMAIREQLLTMDDSKWGMVQTIQLKDPTTSLIISLVGGGALGIDRFYIGDTGLGIAKLLTCGGIGIWTIIDWFLIMGATREKNMEMFQNTLA